MSADRTSSSGITNIPGWWAATSGHNRTEERLPGTEDLKNELLHIARRRDSCWAVCLETHEAHAMILHFPTSEFLKARRSSPPFGGGAHMPPNAILKASIVARELPARLGCSTGRSAGGLSIMRVKSAEIIRQRGGVAFRALPQRLAAQQHAGLRLVIRRHVVGRV